MNTRPSDIAVHGKMTPADDARAEPVAADGAEEPAQARRKDTFPMLVRLIKSVLTHSTVRYLMIGGPSWAFTVLLLNILVVVLGWSQPTAGPVAFMLTFFVSYTLQRTFAFRSEATVTGSMARYLTLAGFNVVVQYPLHWMCERAGLGLATSQVIATGVPTIWNYFAYKHWVYVDRAHPLPADEETVAWHTRAVRRVKAVSNIGGASTTDGRKG